LTVVGPALKCYLPAVSITVKLDLPEDVARKAREAGLLDPARVAGLIERELKGEEDHRSFFEIAREIRSQPGVAMSMEEIQAEVDAVRAERRAIS
jgi:hypothetical protein